MDRYINRYYWNDAELEVINKIGYDAICDKINSLDDKTFNKLMHYFDAWLLGEAPKARLNYWLHKSGMTVEMLNIWCTL